VSATADRSATASRLGGQAAIFLLGNIFTIAVGFPLQVYVARVLGAEELGVFSLLEGIIGIVVGLLGFGVAPALVRFIPEHLEKREFTCIGTLLKRGAVVVGSSGVLALIVVVLLSPDFARWWPETAEASRVIPLMAFLIPLGLVSFVLQQGLRGFQEIRYMVLGSSVFQLTVKATVAVLLLSLGFGLPGYISAVIAGTIFALCWMLIGLRRKLRSLPGLDGRSCQGRGGEWARYASVMYGNSLLGVMTGYLDRFLVGFLAGAGPVGILAVVKQLQMMPTIFLQMLLAVVAPMFSAAHARSDLVQAQHLFNLTTDWVFRAAFPLLMFLMLFAEPLLGLYGEDFAASGKDSLWILVGAATVNLACGPVGNLLNMSGLEREMFWLNVSQAIVLTIGLVLLVPLIGLTGAAISIAAGVVYQNAAALVIAHRRLGIRWWDERYLRWILPAVATALGGFAIDHWADGQAGSWLLAGALACMYVMFYGVSLLWGLHEDDKELLNLFRERLGFGAAH